MRAWRELTLIVVALSAGPFPVHAQRSEALLRATLLDLDSVKVVIQGLTTDAGAAGISERTLRTKVELALRQAGIRVVKDSQRDYFFLDVAIMDVKVGERIVGYAYNVHYSLSRSTYILDGSLPSAALFAVVWNSDQLAMTSMTGVSSTIYETVQDQLEEFLNDYLTANPRQ